MFKWIFSCCMFLTSTIIYGQKELKVTMPVEKATVYLSGAQLFHSKSIALPAGQSDIIVEGISNNLDPASLQAGGTGSFTILDVQYRLYYPEPVVQSTLPDNIQKRITRVQDSITEFDYELKMLMSRREVINLQKTMLMNNKFVRGEGKTDSLALLKLTLEYYNVKLDDLLTELVSIERKEAGIYTQKNDLQIRLNELYNYWNQQSVQANNQPIPQVIISVVAEAAGTATIDLHYLSYSAGWYATYDIKATDIAQPVRLTYKANIWQSSGIDWKDVLLTCSTGNPAIGNNAPQLTTWYLTYYNYMYEERDAVKAVAAESRMDDVQEDLNSYLGNAPVSADYSSGYTVQQQTLTNMEFEIKLKYNIPSDGKSHLVALQDKMLDADYNYLIVPKLDNDAFLVAKITGWEDAGLLPGNANIYFKNSLVGKTSLNTLTLDDTLSISMGRDQSIEVARKALKEKSSDKFIGQNREVEMVYEITVRNNKAIGIDMVVMDQVPISQDESIKVELGDLGKASLEEYTGFLTWRDKVPSKGKKTYQFGYTVTYPKDKIIQL